MFCVKEKKKEDEKEENIWRRKMLPLQDNKQQTNEKK